MEMNRIQELNGETKKLQKARKPAKARTTAKVKTDGLRFYATASVIVMALLSAVLNGYANSLHAAVEWAGWAMGIIIPVIILILGKVAGLLFKRSNMRAAYWTGGIGIGLLFLSVWHVATSIAAVTGSPLLLAMPMAVAIDCGFVACEVAALQE